MANIKDFRNIVFLGHSGAGKTSLTEAILFKTGKLNRLGNVEGKSTVSDYHDEEKQRQHSIYSSLAYTEHAGKQINIIDTPGYPSFLGAALLSIPAAGAGIVVISASSGIEVNTRKLFNAATNADKPRLIVINKMDADNVDLAELVANIRDTFGQKCHCANLPSPDKKTVIDCVTNTEGDSPVMSAEKAHLELLESIIEADDDVMEKYLAGEEISHEEIDMVFVKAMVEGTIVPIVFTNAREDIGIQKLLDLIIECVPSPCQAHPSILKDGEEETAIIADPAGPLAAHVFRVGYDPKSNMKYVTMRILSGTLTSNTQMHINDIKKPIRPGHPLKMMGAEAIEIDAGIAGDIITLAKIDEAHVGDLIHDGSLKGHFVTPPLPKPMYSLALEPAARGDESKISGALDKMTSEDSCFITSINKQTKELVISGLDDLHLRIMLSHLENHYKIKVNTKPPKIPYRETIGGKGEGHYKHRKQSGGAGQFGEVYLRIEPTERDADPSLEYSWDIFGGSIPGQFEPAVLKGLKDVMANGVVAGFPLQDVKVSVYDGKYHPVDSKEVAFRAAGKGAFLEALKNAKPSLLEPIVAMEITVPADNMGDITGDIAGRRGRIEGQDMLSGGMVVIKAHVPLSEVTQYNSQLKSVTGGQGSYSMELSHYEPTPPNVQQQVIAQFQREKEAE